METNLKLHQNCLNSLYRIIEKEYTEEWECHPPFELAALLKYADDASTRCEEGYIDEKSAFDCILYIEALLFEYCFAFGRSPEDLLKPFDYDTTDAMYESIVGSMDAEYDQ